ncbi:MAG: DEAD/DEAH box helicase [Vicinamibacterales bacterium]|jgi:ATP-dependent RNA helicase RhlE|nr:DEAD/DEAH box helicase [Vicinamibacterales bacterium]
MAPRTKVPFEVAPHDATPLEFSELGLDSRLIAGIEDRGFVRTTPIQSAVFPIVAAGSDLIACAETGTGKTAAFLLPIMQRLLAAQSVGTIRVLVLAPTRELAVQIEDDFTGFAYHTTLTGIAVYGGVDGDIQFRALRAGADVVVATPGRLLDHMNTGIVDFGKVEVLVLDEADRMLDMGFWPDVRKIVSALPAVRQTLLFSATTSSDVVMLAEQVMRDPRFIQIGRAGGPATTIAHIAHMMPAREKVEWLTRFLRRTHAPSLIFVRTKRGADQLASSLASRGVRCAPLHADRTQKERSAAVEGFRSGRHTALVATDIAARGLDIDGIAHVINYEVPHSADSYVHRVGRTGRAESAGTAITLVAPDELPTLHAIEKSIDIYMDKPEPPSPEPGARD